MRIGRPGVCFLYSLDQVAKALAGGHPQTECAIDVHPGVVLMGQVADLVEWVDSAAIQIAGGEGNNRRRIGVFLKLGF